MIREERILGHNSLTITETEIKGRIKALQLFMQEKAIDLIILNQNSDLYYYTGTVQPLYALIPVAGMPILIARKAILRIKEEAAMCQVEFFSNTKSLQNIIAEYQLEAVNRLGFTLDAISYASVKRLTGLFPQAEVLDISLDLRLLRMVKSQTEIGLAQKAGEILAEIPKIIYNSFNPGMTELELSATIEKYFRLNGHGLLIRCRKEGIEAGFGVCASGENALAGTKFDGICSGKGLAKAVPFGAANEVIEAGRPVILDYVFNLEGYHVDQTRMFSWGHPGEEIMDAYQAMVRIQQILAASLKPGESWSSLYETALKLVCAAGYETEFMGIGSDKVKFIGHGVGLELDEPPFIAPKMENQLAAGMVLALEPKVALPGVGVVGIEDTYVVEETGGRVLTKCPKNFIIFE